MIATALITEIDNALADANSAMLWTLGLMVVGIGLASYLCMTFVRSIERRIDSVVEPLDRLALGDLEVAIPDHHGTEFSGITRAMEVFKGAAVERAQDEERRAEVISTLRDRLKALAAGNLNKSIEHFFAAEYAPIRMDFNEAQATLREAILEVVNSSNEIDQNAHEVSEAPNDLSERTACQAATLEEAAAALKRTTQGVQSSAELAQDTNEQVAKTRQAAAENGEIVKSAVEAMDQIQSSFAEVEQITNMIQDIAFQTNILALNAGVEATRAGEAGKRQVVVRADVWSESDEADPVLAAVAQGTIVPTGIATSKDSAG